MSRRNRRVGIVAVLALSTLAAAACDEGLTEINENPNNPETVPVNNLLLGGVRDVAQNSGERGTFGKWTMLYHAENWAQHIAQPVYNDEDFYIPRSGIPEVIWDEMYFALADLNEAKRLAEEAGDDNIWAIAEIMTVYGFMILTDYYGDIPYSEALQLNPEGGEVFPAYEAQSVIYPDLIARLEAAEGRLDPTALIEFGDFDPVYDGDVEAWGRFANSLQLRLAMRMSNDDLGAAQTAFEAAWAEPVFLDVTDEADIDWGPSDPGANPVYEGLVFAGRMGDFRMSQSLIDRLVAFDDPRLPLYAQPAEYDGEYRGLRNGLMPGDTAYADTQAGESCPWHPQTTPATGCGDADFSIIGEMFLEPTQPSDLMSYAEVLFLGAEAAELGWNVGGQTAAALYDAAITASMTDHGVEAGAITTYLGQASVDYNAGTYQGLDAIHVQKWIALFLAGPEAFSDLRRYGWDWNLDAGSTGLSLEPAEHSDLAAGEFPSRLTYPQNEPLVNPENYPGDAALTDDLWWMP